MAERWPRLPSQEAVLLALEWPAQALNHFAHLFARALGCEQGVVMLQDPQQAPGVLKVVGTHGISEDQFPFSSSLRVDVQAEDLARLAFRMGLVRVVYTHKDQKLGPTEKWIKDTLQFDTLMCCSIRMPDGTLGLIYATCQQRHRPRAHQTFQAAQVAQSLTLGLHHQHLQGQLGRVQAHLQQVLDHIPDLLVTLRHGMFVSVNATCGRLLGHRPEDLLGRFVHDFIHPEDAQHIWKEPLPTAAEQTWTGHLRFLHKNGGVVPLAWQTTPLPSGDLLGVGRASPEAAFLAPASAGLETALVWSIDLEGNMSFSRPLLERLGLENNPTLSWKDVLHPEDLSTWEQHLQDLQHHPGLGMWEGRLRFFPEGHVQVRVSSTAICSPQGMLVGFSGLVQTVEASRQGNPSVVPAVRLN